jgi:hypothetical protein
MPTQTLLWQSAATLQPSPAAQLRQMGPPQSTPVSLAFLAPSEQLGGTQTASRQALL